MQEMQVWSLGRENPLEKETATHSSILFWDIPWTEEPGVLQFFGSQRTEPLKQQQYILVNEWVNQPLASSMPSVFSPVTHKGQVQQQETWSTPPAHRMTLLLPPSFNFSSISSFTPVGQVTTTSHFDPLLWLLTGLFTRTLAPCTPFPQMQPEGDAEK